MYGCEFVGGSSAQLVSGSGESLFLWDMDTGARLAEAGPTPELRGEAPGALSCPVLFLHFWKLSGPQGTNLAGHSALPT